MPLAPSGALPSFCSRHPRIPPVAGNPFRPAGGLRTVNLRLPRLPPSVAACASIENSSYRVAMRGVFQSLMRLLRKGLPATGLLVGDAGLRPPLKDRSLGRPKSAWADFLWRLPPSNETRAWARITLEAATRRHGSAVLLSLPHTQFRCMSRFAHQCEIGAAPNWRFDFAMAKNTYCAFMKIGSKNSCHSEIGF